MSLSDNIQKLRDFIVAEQPECERLGYMDPVHKAAWNNFSDNQTALTLREAFALGEVYQSASVESALYAIDELKDE